MIGMSCEEEQHERRALYRRMVSHKEAKRFRKWVKKEAERDSCTRVFYATHCRDESYIVMSCCVGETHFNVDSDVERDDNYVIPHNEFRVGKYNNMETVYNGYLEQTRSGILYIDEHRGYILIATEYNGHMRFTAGCRWFSLSDALYHWTKFHPNRRYVEAIAEFVGYCGTAEEKAILREYVKNPRSNAYKAFLYGLSIAEPQKENHHG